MTLSYLDFERALSSSGSMFELVETHEDGSTHHYRGRDLSAFLARKDRRHHEHKVYDSEGQLCYHRDRNGKLYVGGSEQFQRALRRQQAGRIAVSGVQTPRQTRDRTRR